MNPVVVRNLKIGEGIPKICVPIVNRSKEAILKTAESFKGQKFDLVEWRADWYEDIYDFVEVKGVLADLREILGEVPILFTFRSMYEGGSTRMSDNQYKELNGYVCRSTCADLVDVEVFSYPSYAAGIIRTAHEHGKYIVASNHDFHGTPEQNEMLRRLCEMQKMGADIAKIAVMPLDHRDVLKLLAATEEMTRLHPETPVITMSMSATGVVSRICGESFGSAVTFGAVGRVSAPGQIQAGELAQALAILHRGINGNL